MFEKLKKIQPIMLIFGVILGFILGIILKEKAIILKPIGTIFINLLFTSVVPMVFISITNSIAHISNIKRLTKILFFMFIIFISTGFIAGTIMTIIVNIFNPAYGVSIELEQFDGFSNTSIAEQIISIFTVNDFISLLTIKNITPLIVFSIFLGFAVKFTFNKSTYILNFLSDANKVFINLINIIMYFAPIGLCAYIAVLVGELGSKLVEGYIRACLIYFPVSILYLIIFFPIYAYISYGMNGIKSLKYLIPTALTSFSTQSSIASLAINLEAARKIGINEDIRNIIIPIGSTLHMDGTCLGNIIKIYFSFGILGIEIQSIQLIILIIIVSIFSSSAAGAIPGGGLISEMIIASIFNLPIETIPIMGTIGILVDSVATMINSVGDNIVCMMVSRIIEGKNIEKMLK